MWANLFCFFSVFLRERKDGISKDFDSEVLTFSYFNKLGERERERAKLMDQSVNTISLMGKERRKEKVE